MLLMVSFTACGPETGSDTIRAGIIAEDFVKEELLSPDDLEWNLVGTDEVGKDSYHVVANIKALNGLGFKVPRKVSVRLKYNGDGDWTDINNWEKQSVKFLDESTGTIQ